LEGFRDTLKVWIGSLFGQVFDSSDKKGKPDDTAKGSVLQLQDLSLDPKTEEKVRDLYELVLKAKEPRRMYEEVRDALKSLYKYLFASGLLTLLGLVPQIPGVSGYDLLYFVFLFPLMAAAFSWDTYHKAEDVLIKLRDEGA
jgi:hypothetical protein